MIATASPERGLDEAIGVGELRGNLGQVVDAAHYGNRVTTVSRYGRRVAVIISASMFDQLTEACAVHESCPERR